jgi:hypothetical protein
MWHAKLTSVGERHGQLSSPTLTDVHLTQHRPNSTRLYLSICVQLEVLSNV